MTLPRVVVAEPSLPICNALRKFLQGAAEVQVVHYLDEAVQVVRGLPPDVLIASASGTFEGDVLARQVKKIAPQVGVVLVYPPEEAKALERAEAVGADGCLVGPLKRTQVLAQVRQVLRLRALEAKVAALEGQLLKAKSAPPAPAPVPKPRAPAPGVNTADEAFFKKFLLLEVKRSKRYQYPVALMIVALDGLTARLEKESAPDFQRAAIRTEVVTALGELVRDIDLAVPFADEKYLVFLPHTPRQGCIVVANRVVARLQKLDHFSGGTASVGVASYDPRLTPKAQVSFGQLVREASMALKAAAEAGGNRAEIAAHADAPKRNRISMG
jgi:PleD family two-component response regulator